MFCWNWHRVICESTVIGCMLAVGLALAAATAHAGEIALVPVDATSGHAIVDNEIVLTSRDQRVTLEVRLSGWSPDELDAYNAKIDSSTYASGEGAALTPLTSPDASAGAFVDTAHMHWVFQYAGSSAQVDTSTLDYEWIGWTVLPSCVTDGGDTYYGGTLILEVPADADGTYTVEWNTAPAFTFMNDCTTGDITPITVSSALITLTASECGNGDIEGSEECDDGNRTPGDGCNENCRNKIEIETVTVRNPGNAGELSGEGAGGLGPDRICGAVHYVYKIGKLEVTAGQYVEFLYAVAATDSHRLYDTRMDSDSFGCQITRHGNKGSYWYDFSGGTDEAPGSTAADWADRPVNFVSWGDAARFCNWMHNGQPTGAQDLTTTEDGSYYLNGTTNWEELMAVVRKEGATWVIPSEDEWYKAAYHKDDGVTGNYWDYPTESNTSPTSEAPPGTDMTNGSANYLLSGWHVGNPYYRTEVGAYGFKPSDSPYGTFDQCGNVSELNEAVMNYFSRGARGGAFISPGYLRAADRAAVNPESATFARGFRVADVSEFVDCDNNGVNDTEDVANCDGSPWCRDCNHNDVPDGCDIDDQTSQDDVGPGGIGGTDGIPDECQLDMDGDGHNDADDNCPEAYNPGQEDQDSDNVGDLCDNCLQHANPGQENQDSDNFGDLCDNCPEDYNPGQEDQDSDNVGDLCDNCPEHNNPGQENCDQDNVGDVCAIADGPSLDCNSNGIPDECEPDCDGNGVQDDCDIRDGRHPDCNRNRVPDKCDVPAPGGICTVDCSEDCTGDGVPDECEDDCNENEVADSCDIADCTPGDVLCTDCDFDGVPDGCQIGACCLDADGDGTYEGCAEDSASMCEAGEGIFRGPCQDCPDQNTAIIPEEGGEVFVHVIDAPIDCLPETGGGLRRSCPPGAPKIDPWKSDADAQMCQNFGVTNSPVIPAGFFCPVSDPTCGSDEWAGGVCLEGVPLGDPLFPNADTLISRTADPFDRCDVVPFPTTAAPVEIEVIALSLKSIDPITVTYDGQNSESWDVTVDLSTFVTDPPLPAGTLTATKTHCNGGTYTSVLHVQARFTFTKVGSNPAEVRILDTGEEGIPYVTLDQQDPVPWVADIDPDSGVTGDPCSDFHPGIDDTVQVTDCDCNGNTTHDKCDIETDSSDCDENGIPDECDPDADGDGVPNPCDVCSGFDDLADSDGDGVPDSCDICPDGDDNVDTDGDGVADGCDDCPNDNPDDADGDGICTSNDNCVLYNPQQIDCQPNGVGDICDFGRGTSTDENGNAIPDECDANSLLPAPAPYDFRKNRYIAFNSNNTDPIVIQVQVAELVCDVSGDACSYDEDCPDFASGERCLTPNGFDPVSAQADPEWEAIGWLGEPCTITPGTQVPADTWHSMVVSDMPTLPGFEYTDAGTGDPLSTVFVGDCEIMPRFSYGLRASGDGSTFSERLVIGTIREPVNNAKKWADVVGQRDAGTGEYTEPNRRINVDDVQVMIVFLNSKSYRPHLTVLDLSHEVPGYKINADDLQMVMRAFGITEDYPPLKFQVEASGATHPRECPSDAAGTVHEKCQ